MTERVLWINNETNKPLKTALFQKLEFIGETLSIIPVAWGVARLNPGSIAQLFVPEEASIVAGDMTDGVFQKKVSEPVDVDPNRRSFQLKKAPDGGMDFAPSIHYTPKEHVCIQAVGKIPLQGSAVGIGLQGEATCVFNIRNDWDYQFRATPQLYLAFSEALRNGQAIGPEIQSIPLTFFPNSPNLFVFLNSNGTWSLSERNKKW